MREVPEPKTKKGEEQKKSVQEYIQKEEAVESLPWKEAYFTRSWAVGFEIQKDSFAKERKKNISRIPNIKK